MEFIDHWLHISVQLSKSLSAVLGIAVCINFFQVNDCVAVCSECEPREPPARASMVLERILQQVKRSELFTAIAVIASRAAPCMRITSPEASNVY